MKEKRLYIKYRLSGNVYEDDLYQNEHYTIEEEVSEYGIKTVIIPKEKIELIAFSLKYKRKCVAEERFFANGYQSWTTSQEYTADDKENTERDTAVSIPLHILISETTRKRSFTVRLTKRRDSRFFMWIWTAEISRFPRTSRAPSLHRANATS